MSDTSNKLFIIGAVIAGASLWLGSYILSFATSNNSWFVFPTLVTMTAGIFGGMALVFKACND